MVLDAHALMVLFNDEPGADEIDYALRTGPPYRFELDERAMERAGCQVFFSSAVEVAERCFETIGTSRAVALAASAPTLARARERVVGCARAVPVLEWRRDVGDEAYLEGLRGLLARQPA